MSDDERERLEQKIQAVRDELDRLRAAAGADIQNLQNDVLAKNRQIGQLKKELSDFREGQPETGPVKELLILWKTLLGKNARTYTGLDGKRAKIASLAVRKWGQPRCEKAIVGLSLQPWAGPRGRAAQEYPGAKRYDDIEHALGDEVRMENLVKVADMYERPTLLDEPVGPGPVAAPLAVADTASDREREPEREYDPAPGLLMITPTKGRPADYHHGGWRGDTTPPSTKVIASLHDRGCTVKPNPTDVDRWIAQCPAHEDRDPSLSIERKPDGMLLVHCFAGCDIGDIMAALNLDVRELWAGSERDYSRANAVADGLRPKPAIPAHLRRAMQQLLERDQKAAA